MKDYLKNVNGWGALLIIIITIALVGFTKLLNKNLNLTLLVLFAVSIAAVYFYNCGKLKGQGKDTK